MKRVEKTPDSRLFQWTRAHLSSRFLILFSLAIAFSVIVIFFVRSSQPSEVISPGLVPRRSIDLSKPGVSADVSQHPRLFDRSVLRVAIAPVISPKNSIQIYRGLVEHISERLGKRPELLLRETYGETNDLIRYERCDLALVCTYAFVRGELEFGMEMLVVPVINGVTNYHSLILVSAESQASTLLDLEGARFASADIMSTSGWLYPAMWLKERGVDANEFFSEHLVVGSHDRSIRAVASGYADAAAVDSLVYEQVVRETPAVAEKTRVIQKSPAYGMPPVVVSPGIDATLREELRSILLSMHEDDIGQSVLTDLNIDRFVVPEDALYDDIRRAVRIWEAR